MTNKEKRDNARNRLVKNIIENVIMTTGAREVIDGARGSELRELLEREAYLLITQYETKYIGASDE
jgi:hypothetical protein